jgi:hypothetical protein
MDRYSFIKVRFQKNLRLVYKPHSVRWITPSVQSSLWAARRRAARCSLPGAGSTHKREEHVRRRAVSHRPQTISPLLGLAPGGGYLAICITADAGGLLHHLFTITHHPKGWKGCLFLWPFSGRFVPFGSSPPRLLSDAVLLWSADFPRSRQRRTATARPA